MTLGEARAKAREIRARVELGGDPALDKRQEREERRREAVASRFRDVCDLFVRDQENEWRPSTKKGWTRYIESEIKPAIGDRRPDDVTPEMVRAMIDRIK